MGLSDPAVQPKFVNAVPDALDPSFKFTSPNGKFKIGVRQTVQMTGLVGIDHAPVPTPVQDAGQSRDDHEPVVLDELAAQGADRGVAAEDRV